MENERVIERVNTKLLTAEELAQAIGVSYHIALELTKIKSFPILTIGKRRYAIANKVDDWISENMYGVFTKED